MDNAKRVNIDRGVMFRIGESDEDIDKVNFLVDKNEVGNLEIKDSNHGKDELKLDNTDTEEDAIKQSCQFIGNFVDTISRSGLKKMNDAAKKNLEEIRLKFLELDLGLEKGRDVVIAKANIKSDPEKVLKLDKEGGVIPKQYPHTIKSNLMKTVKSSSEYDGSGDSTAPEVDNSFSRVSRSRNSKPRNSRDEFFAKLLDKLDNRRVPKLEDYDDKSGEDLQDYLKKFETYCQENIRGDSSFWVGELQNHLSGDTLKAFISLRDNRDRYHQIKEKLVTWDKETKDLKKKKAKDKFLKLKMEKNEALYLYSNRLEKQFKLTYPKHKTETSKHLIDKFTESVPSSIKKQIRAQIISDKINERPIYWKSIQKFARYHDLEKKNDYSESSSEEEVIINLQHNPRPKKNRNDYISRETESQNDENFTNPQVFYSDQTKNSNGYNYQDNQRRARDGERRNQPENPRSRYFSYNNKEMEPQNQSENRQSRYSSYNTRDIEFPNKSRNYQNAYQRNDLKQISRNIPNIANCNYCNRMGHNADNCRLRLRLCFICGKSGHRMDNCYFNQQRSHQRSQSQPPQRDFKQNNDRMAMNKNFPSRTQNETNLKNDQTNRNSFPNRNRTASN